MEYEMKTSLFMICPKKLGNINNIGYCNLF
jgi:hypothetical protein